MTKERILIKGVTLEGRSFRPSDWAQRLATAVANVDRERRISFHPHVGMATVGGVNCVTVDPVLAEQEPMLFEFLMNFARTNHLQVEDVLDEDEDEG